LAQKPTAAAVTVAHTTDRLVLVPIDISLACARSAGRRAPSATPARERCRSSAASAADAVGVLYADTSALVKLAVEEAETDALRRELNEWDAIATSVITEIELARARPQRDQA